MKSRRVMILVGIIAALGVAGLLPTLLGDKTAAEAPLVAMNPNAARPGKVWSSEHGHWHDVTPGGGAVAAASAIPTSPALTPIAPRQQFTPKPQPEGPVPAGKVWSTEHGHWHDAKK